MGTCRKSLTNVDTDDRYGIHPQILNIVDSVFWNNQDDPLNGRMSIYFYSRNDTIFIDFLDWILVKRGGSPHTTMPEFLGYKFYHSNLLVFFNHNGNYESFIRKDSLIYGDLPNFKSGNEMIRRNSPPSRLIYWINEKDSLIFVEKEYI